ncbi:hypothetical protein FLM55_09235 [Francisella sp. Scap27]|uniref:hypothetical protein n=1 Tax=Francisella sp. Scap27 TaxID=2589986 RepID=UPI0015BAA66A|nr:hypothetical protein [Francisella sp. Scap27]QLE79904.1 hypothetical protein FLM55_09235 [Francisella sp. Scap27]
MKIILIFMVVAIASASGFVVHVITVEWLPEWVGSQMQGLKVTSSWDVRYVAAITSLEYGFSAIIIYHLTRNKLLSLGKFKSALIFSILLIAIHGMFIRQPFMDYIIGNPLNVVLVQNAFKWLVWLLMSFFIVYGYEFVMNLGSKNANKSASL